MSSTSMSVRSPASFPFPTAAGARGRVGSAQPVGPKLLSSPLPPAATPAVPRRLLFPVAAGIWTSFPVAEQAARLPRRSPSGEACSSSGRFEEGAEQFRLDVAANPNDTEESIWCFLCEAQLYGVGLDSRSVMRKAYALFKDGGDAEKKDAELAKSHIVAACRSGDYMASLALVHCECRNWTLE
uniref:Uncharacterized protein n=1 Tax=Oryza glumipatula TaxID=40148 RepID=A0A0D9Y804_9ORYZ